MVQQSYELENVF